MSENIPPDVAEHFGDPRAEQLAAEQHAAVFDFRGRTHIELTGADRAKFLHNFCTNDIRRLQPGQGCEAFVTNVKGRVIGHVFVFAGDESIWLESVPGAEQPLLTHLERYHIREDIGLHGRTDESGELFVTGPEAQQRLALCGLDVAPLGPYEHRSMMLADIPIAARRVDLLRRPGWLLMAPRDRSAELWQRLVDAQCRPAGSAVFDALRIEAGFPLYGIDVTDENLAQEAGRTPECISFTKGCYLGQEPIARLDALGHVNRELRGLRLESGPVPSGGDEVLGDAEQVVGSITSAALSYRDDRPVALAYVRSKFTAPGTRVWVKTAESRVPAVVFWPT